MVSYHITRFSICVPLTDKQWAKLDAIECGQPTLDFIDKLEAVGAGDVEWSGHYGKNLWFAADADFDTCEFGRTVVERVVKKIEELLG